MTKLNLSLAILLIGTAVVAGNTTGCSSKSGGGGVAGATGTAGSTGAAGSTGGSSAAGSTGTGGMPATCAMNTATLTTSPCKCVPGAYVRMGACACQDGMPDICPTVGCVNKKLDVANCGTCGMACGATSTCNAGACGPAPTMVAAGLAGCTAMTIVATDAVYYAANNTVNKVGVATPIATGEMGATLLQANGTNLFWYNTGTKKIRMVAAAGGTPSDVYAAMAVDGAAAGRHGLPRLAGRHDALLLARQQRPQEGGRGHRGPDGRRRRGQGGIPAALALNGTTNIVFPATFNGDVDAPLLSANPAICGMDDPNDPGNAIMTTCPRLGRSQGELFPDFIAVVAGHAYWVDGPNLKGELIGTKGTSFDSIAMAQTSKITAAVSNGTDAIYFADADPNDANNGYIEKTALAPNSTPVLLARGQKSPISIAVDATKVYWATPTARSSAPRSKRLLTRTPTLSPTGRGLDIAVESYSTIFCSSTSNTTGPGGGPKGIASWPGAQLAEGELAQAARGATCRPRP